MGITNCACKRSESEEEMISKIFRSMTIKEIDVNQVYTDFLNCALFDEKDKTEKIDKNLYNNFICKIVNPSLYREAQVDYFQILIDINDVKKNGIKRIGIMIIFLAEGDFSDKVNLLEKHILKYYGKLDKHIKDFISDTIELNTEMCLLSFKNYLDTDSYNSLSLVWKKHRKQQIVIQLYQVYEEIKQNLNEKRDEKVSLLNKFLTISYNNLLGDRIRDNLYEAYTSENNKLYSYESKSKSNKI